jgi:hypothetical protein
LAQVGEEKKKKKKKRKRMDQGLEGLLFQKARRSVRWGGEERRGRGEEEEADGDDDLESWRFWS